MSHTCVPLMRKACIFYIVFTLRFSCKREPAETQTSIRLASHLIRAQNSRTGRHEFKSPMPRKLVALTKKWKDPWGQVFLLWHIMSVCLVG
jgi:hypothetical protein